MSILQNAIDSIQVGLEDFVSGERKRLVSSIRNIHAGLLLLYKEKLCELSPKDDKALLIRTKILPYLENDQLKFRGKQNRSTVSTVNINDIIERFDSLDIKIDKKTVEEIGKLRNDIEHYFSEKPKELVRASIAKYCILIRDFLEKH